MVIPDDVVKVNATEEPRRSQPCPRGLNCNRGLARQGAIANRHVSGQTRQASPGQLEVA